MRNWRLLGARNAEEAKSFYVSAFRRRLGVFVAREFARHRLHRECLIGVPRHLVDLRVMRQGLGDRCGLRLRLARRLRKGKVGGLATVADCGCCGLRGSAPRGKVLGSSWFKS